MNSLDPRVHRLPIVTESVRPQAPLDQFGTYEVFVQPKEGKPFQHEGIVHAPNLEMAYVLAKEAFTRRFTCVSLYVEDTRDLNVSPMTEGEKNAYDLIQEVSDQTSNKLGFEIYHLVKRGKQHVHIGSITGSTPQEAMAMAKTTYNNGKVIYNVWAIQTDKIRFTTEEDRAPWPGRT